MKNKVELYFKIETESDIDLEIISKVLDIQNENVSYYKKGTLKNKKNKKSSAKWEINKWVLDLKKSHLDFATQMNFFLDILETKKDQIIKYSEYSTVYFSSAIYLNTQNESSPYINIDKRYNDFVKETNIDFEIYTYNCVPPVGASVPLVPKE